MHTKIIAWIVLLALCLCLSACKENEQSSETTPYYLDANYWYRKDAEAALANIPVHIQGRPFPPGYQVHYSEPYFRLYTKLRQLPALNRGLPLVSVEDYKEYILTAHRCLRLIGYRFGFPDCIYYFSNDVIEFSFPTVKEVQMLERAKGRGIDTTPYLFTQMGYSDAYMTLCVDSKTGELVYMNIYGSIAEFEKFASFLRGQKDK